MSSPTPETAPPAEVAQQQQHSDEATLDAGAADVKGKGRAAEGPTEEEQAPGSDGEKDSASDDDDAQEAHATPALEAEASTSTQQPSAAGTPWQAVFAPQYNAYYFFNSQTGETTWQNPLDPSASAAAAAAAAPSTIATASTTTSPDAAASTSASPPPAGTPYTAAQQAALAQGIDPALAYLDPSLTAATPGPSAATAFAAKFNARTGAFTGAAARDPAHLSEYERMRRMNSVFFDMDKWEQDAQARAAAEQEAGKKRKRPTKKDLERFKEQKRQKKIAKTAWLRT
ncbi:hypothetical protein HDZ31DRAFT_82156 [Schizophyllum fasciatum]